MEVSRVFLVVIVVCILAERGTLQSEQVFALERQKSYYFGSTFKINWFKAAEFCRSRGMFLVSAINQEHLEEIVSFVNNSGIFATANEIVLWTSGNDLGEEGQFHWASTGDRLTLNVWGANEPNNIKFEDGWTEDCVQLKIETYENDKTKLKSKINDVRCRVNAYFMCETLVN